MSVQQLAGLVGGAVVHDDDVQTGIIRLENGVHRLHDDAFLVVRGNQHGHAGKQPANLRTVRAQLLDEGQYANDEGAAADENNAQNKCRRDQYPKPVVNPENETVGTSFKLFLRGKRQHHLSARSAKQVGHGDKFVPLRAKRVDELRERGDRLAAITAAIVEENDVALGRFMQNILDNFCGWKGNARVKLAPIVWIHFLADDDVAHILGDRQVRDFFGKIGLMVDAVRWAEEQRLHAKNTLDEPLG